MNRTPIEWGEMACMAIMHEYEPQNLPPKDTFFYHQGVFLSGMQNVYLLTGKREYFKYIKDYVDSVIGPNGEIPGFVHEQIDENTPWLAALSIQCLDHRQPTIILYNLYDETGDERYLAAIRTAAESMYYYPINRLGGYWHMMLEPNQMWLDGAYMSGPLSVMYDERFDAPLLRERAIKQIFLMEENMRDSETGLYYHGWDISKKQAWADPASGLSSQFWGRAVGWFTVAVLDIIEHLPKDHPSIPRLSKIEAELLKALVKYQDKKTGMWFEVLDKPERGDNWIESSCTCLFIYSYAKAIRTGVIGAEYSDILEKAYNGIISTLYIDEEGYLVIDNVCEGTCINEGTYEHYISRKRCKNDLHGAGAFILMCAEMQRYIETKE